MVKVKLVILLAFIFMGSTSIAQFEETYIPKNNYTEKDKDLIKRVQNQLSNELKSIDSYKAQRIFKSNTDYLVRHIKFGGFIKDDTLQAYVQEVFNNLLNSNGISPEGKTIFISKNPDINAICFGEGSFFVTVGLLRKMESEGQLAFTLAHEIAHYELNHVKKKVTKMAESNEEKKLNKIANKSPTIERLEELKELFYIKNRYSRSIELEADSLGFILYTKAQYDPTKALELIDQLNFSNFPKQHLGQKLFLPFHFRKFPFNEAWLDKRLNVYNRTPERSLIFDLDSIQSHPDFEVRKSKLKTFIDRSKPFSKKSDNPKLDLVIKTAELEAIESAFFARKYDLCLFLALELKPIYPKNEFINLIIVHILINLYEAHENRLLEYFVSPFTSEYHEELRMVNNFLFNAKKSDLGEIAFHFMNQKSHFNPGNQQHYYLLWKISGLTRRFSFQEKILSAYLEKFPDGKYKVSMK